MNCDKHVNIQLFAKVKNILLVGLKGISNISRIGQCLGIDSTKTLVHVQVASRLDYCNALLYGLPDNLIQILQYVMNAVAKVITCTRKFDHVTPLPIEPHWLPVRQCIVLRSYCTPLRHSIVLLQRT